MNPAPAYCHRCQMETPTIYLPLSSGHVGNCCSICRATRKGRPFISREEFQAANAATNGRGRIYELSPRSTHR
mgnify:CR=1 FL=1